MNKTRVDEIIAAYMQKIFGYALTKTMNTDKAQELASRITFDVYTSLLKADDIANIDGYVYRVAANVFARYVHDEVKGRRQISLDEVILPSESDFTLDIENDETYIRLRREISYLGKLRREIIVLHYFEKKKQYEIADRLNIPLNTVKWHLHEAKNDLKKGITEMTNTNNKGMLGVSPIRLESLGHSGMPAPDGKDTAYYLKNRITQNVAYAAYHEPKTISEIAQELGTSAAFIEDEVAMLEEYGFMDKVAGDKYQTNMYITEPSEDAMEAKHEIYLKYAKIVREKYVPLILDALSKFDSSKVYVPENDVNFFTWFAVAFACGQKLHTEREAIDISKYAVRRKDGGYYVAFAAVEKELRKLNFNPNLYGVCGDMTRGDGNAVYAWQIDTFYDSREGGWVDNLNEDYVWLYEYMTGKLNKEEAEADKFKRLYDKGYIMQNGGSEYVNMIVSTIPNDELSAMLPAIPDDLKPLDAQLYEEIYKIENTQYPKHMQQYARAHIQAALASNAIRMRVIEMLVADGTLKPLTDAQKCSLNTIMFCDTLPK